ncbi:MAG: hypothetical protein GY786_06810 [Proteobacteria bacterium]|nr:hypothetical protein [Pseudomonadota bacterium]
MDSIPEKHVYGLLDALQIEEEFTRDKELMDRMMPAMKADIVLMKNKNVDENSRVGCPVVIVAGDKDHIYSVNNCLKPWERYTEDFSLVEVNGGHFFLKEETGKNQLLSLIKKEMETGV